MFVECAAVETIEPGRASLNANAAPAPTEGTASVKLIGMAEKLAPQNLRCWSPGQRARHGVGLTS